MLSDHEREELAEITKGLSPLEVLNLARCYAWRAYWLQAAAESSLVLPQCLPRLSASVPWPVPPQSELHWN